MKLLELIRNKVKEISVENNETGDNGAVFFEQGSYSEYDNDNKADAGLLNKLARKLGIEL